MTDRPNPALGEGWFPSRWCADDERGAGNLLGPHKVLEASRLIRTGEMVSLGFPYRTGMPLSPGRTFGLKMPGGPTGGWPPPPPGTPTPPGNPPPPGKNEPPPSSGVPVR